METERDVYWKYKCKLESCPRESSYIILDILYADNMLPLVPCIFFLCQSVLLTFMEKLLLKTFSEVRL